MKKPNIKISRMGVPQVKKGCLAICIKILIYIISAIGFSILFFYGFKYLEVCIRNVYCIKPYNEDILRTWTSSATSYWGGIFGGAISGILSLGGTFLVIKYYRKADIKNRQISNQPFLNIRLVGTFSKKPSDLEDVLYLCDIGNGKKIIYAKIEIRNVGKSFARTGVYYNDSNFGGCAFEYIIEAGDAFEKKVLIGVKYNDELDEINLGIMFFDCFMNEYIQDFNFKVDNNGKGINVSVDYPNLTQSAFK